MSTKVLFVDDDVNLLAALGRTFRDRFPFETAASGEEALALLGADAAYGVVVVDMNMPGMNGIELLERMQRVSPHAVSLMLTGNADQRTAVDCVNRGRVFRFINKPCPPDVLVPAIDAALQHHELKRTERELLEGTLTGCVKLLTDVLGTVAAGALGRGQRLRLAIGQFARHRTIEPVWECEVAALLSEIGYAAVPPSISQKLADGEPLTLAEEAIARRVPQIGRDLLAEIPRFSGVADAVLYQKKHFDGTGYPSDDVAGEDIPVAARLIRLFSDRLELENDGVVKDQARTELEQRKGFYDPHLLDACFSEFPTFLPNAIAGDRPVGSVSVKQLVAGQVVVTDVCAPNGVVLVGAGHTLTPTVIERINNFAALGEVKEPILVQEAA